MNANENEAILKGFELERKKGDKLPQGQLSQLRRGQTTVVAANDNRASKTSTGKRRYEAFDSTGSPSPYTEIRCVLQPSQSPQSRFFMAVVFSSDDDDAFTLLYSYMAVEVKGHNLKEVRRAIQTGRCEFIQQYHENAFTRPGKGDPVIESINFITGEKLDDILSTYKGEK
jgi:hypothetical protein